MLLFLCFTCLVLNISKCKTLTCDSDPCMIQPTSNDIVICTNKYNTCTIDCRSYEQCKGSKSQHLIVYSGSPTTNILCNNYASCLSIELNIGEQNIIPNGYNINDFNRNKLSTTINCDHKTSCKGAEININGYFSKNVTIFGYDDDSLQSSNIFCGLHENQYCILNCGDPTVASCDSTSFVCNSGECQCNGMSCPVVKMNSENPTQKPVITNIPTLSPTMMPTIYTNIPTTKLPTNNPITTSPTILTILPTTSPSITTVNPSLYPTVNPSINTVQPSLLPSINPTKTPSIETKFPTKPPILLPTLQPSIVTDTPTTLSPTNSTVFPTNLPTLIPSVSSNIPTLTPTDKSITITPNKGDTIICTNEYGICIIDCSTESQCTDGLIVYSGAKNTRVKCNRDKSCVGATFNIGIPSIIPDNYNIENFKGIKQSFMMSCVDSHSCQYSTINIDGYFTNDIIITSLGTDSFEDGKLNVNLYNNNSTSSLHCGDKVLASCEDVTYNCGSNGFCECLGSGCPNITTQKPTMVTFTPTTTPMIIPSISPSIPPSNLPSNSPTIIIINDGEYFSNNFPDYGYAIIGGN